MGIALKIGSIIASAGLLMFLHTHFSFSGESFASDFTPPKNEVSSFRVNSFFSDREDFKGLDKQINRFMRRENLAGASLAVAKDGKLVYAKGYGLADKENQVEVEPYHLFRIASVSKLITAVGIMKLQEAGMLKLDDKVFGVNGILNDARFLNYKDKKVEDITVENLLNHSGGWSTRYGDQMFMPEVVSKYLDKDLPVDASDIIEFVLSKRLHFRPGTMSYYSNFGYAVLGKVIEKVSGLNYESYIQTHVLYALGIFDMQLGGSFSEELAEH